MADLSKVKAHMTVVDAQGVAVGTVDHVEGKRIKLKRAENGTHKSHHHYLSGGLVAAVEGDQVRLSAAGPAVLLLEEEQDGKPITDLGS